MNRYALLILGACLLPAAAGAQSGNWAPASGWSVRQGHAAVVFNGRMWVIGGSDGATSTSDVWSSVNGADWILETGDAGWSPRTDHAAVAYSGRLWVMGGRATGGSANDVWSSADGVNWTQETAGANWAARYGHTVTEYNGKLWLLGGRVGFAASNEAWTSADGINWTQESTPPWPARFDHAVTVFNNDLYVIAGSEGFTYLNDVWSYDGISWGYWTNAAFGSSQQRCSLTAAGYNGKLWVMGGYRGAHFANGSTCADVLSSADGGITWTQEAGYCAWDSRRDHSALVFNNRMWLIGGLTNSWLGTGLVATTGSRGRESNDVWSSTDGINWTKATEDGGFNGWKRRHNLAALTFNGRVWVMGGLDGGLNHNDVWSSPDGSNWIEENPNAPWMARAGHAAAVFNNEMWIMGGTGGASSPIYLNDMWSSPDGINWTQATPAAPWSAREEHAVAVFQNRLWVMGGRNGTTRLSDVWSSSDGINWTLETSTPGWTSRTGHAVATLNGKLWLTGGHDGAVDFNEVWSSADGVNWVLEVANAPWLPRAAHTLVEAHSRLWLVGGHETELPFTSILSSTPLTWPHKGLRDAWHSPDGVNWMQGQELPTSGRSEHAMAAFGDKLIVLGGRYGRHMVDISLAEAWCADLPVVELTGVNIVVDEGVINADISVHLNAEFPFDVEVAFETSAGTATQTADYGAVSTLVTIPAGQTGALVTVPVYDDNIDEPDETVLFQIHSPANAVLGQNVSGTLVIMDNDGTPGIHFTSASYQVDETGGSVTIKVSLTNPSSFDVNVNYAASDVTAIAGADYTGVTGLLTIPAGEVSATLAVPVIDDNLHEGVETFEVVLSNPVHAGLGALGVATVEITDDEPVPELGFSASVVHVNEKDGLILLTAELTGPSGHTVTAEYGVIGVTATPGKDCSGLPGTVTFAPGATSAQVSIWLFDDNANEPDEELLVSLSNPTHCLLSGGATATVIIREDDADRALSDSTDAPAGCAAGNNSAPWFLILLSIAVTALYARRKRA